MARRLTWLVWWSWALVVGGCTGPAGGFGPGAGHADVDSLPPGRDASGLSATAEEAPPGPIGPTAWASAPGSDGPLRVLTDPGELPALKLANQPEQRLPLEHTGVKAQLHGFVAEVEVTQTFGNPFDRPIEAVYVFPLPENSAVHHMRMVIGQREIVAKIEERKRAKRIYETAKREGYTAALLEQERPNVFTQSVANIEPGKPIAVVIRYVQDLTYDAGRYEFVFPMVVGPRFMPGDRLAGPPAGQGTHADTVRVVDASRISPPIMGQGQRSGHDIAIEVLADTSLAVSQLQVPTHEVITDTLREGTMRLRLADKESLPNRDFVMRYRVAGESPKATLFRSGEGAQGGFFSLVVHPPALDVDALVGQREIIFVVDVSGSMSGTPLGMCRSAMREAIGRLRPVDTFNILTFSGATQAAFPSPRPANQANVRQGLAVVDEMRAGGGTHMADAVSAALSTDVAAGRHRYVFFLTDGYVGNEDEIIAASARFVQGLGARGQRARVFGFGVGSSVNRYLIDGLSRAGKGIAVYATTREDPARAVNRFYHYIDRAVVTDMRVDWGGWNTREILPRNLPDLFASHPVILHGRYRGAPNGPIVVRGRAGSHELSMPVTVREARAAGDAYEVQGALWARSKVTALEEHLWDGAVAAVQRDILRLGLAFHLVTRFTSFVAVDRSRRVSGGDPRTVVQPVEAPEGVDVEAAGGVRVQDGREQKRRELLRGSVMAGQLAPPPPAPGAGAAAPPAAVSMEYAEEEAADEDAPASPDMAVYDVEPKRGCGCRVGRPDSSAGRVSGWLVALLWLALRSRRRGAAGPRRDLRRGPGDEVGFRT